MATNPKLVSFFKQYYAPARICLVGADDLVGDIIRRGQSPLNDDQPSKWSHTFLFGNMKGDQIEIYESDIEISLDPLRVKNGAQKSRLTKWCSNKIEHAAVLDFKLSQSKQRQVIEVAEKSIKGGLSYPIIELIGTLIAIYTGTLNQQNLLDLANSMYCSSFVRFCYRKAGADFLPPNKPHISNTAPVHIAKTGRIIVEWAKGA